MVCRRISGCRGKLLRRRVTDIGRHNRLRRNIQWRHLHVSSPTMSKRKLFQVVAFQTLTAMEISTERIILRQWRHGDFDPFSAMNADPQVMEFFPSTLSRAQSDATATRLMQLIDERGWGFWALEIPGVAEFAGFVGLHVPETVLPFSPCVEIGWRLARGYWGKGYATEAANAAMAFGFDELGLAEIVSFTAAINLRSQKVMQRTGMTWSGEVFQHPNVDAASPLRPHVLYRKARP